MMGSTNKLSLPQSNATQLINLYNFELFHTNAEKGCKLKDKCN